MTFFDKFFTIRTRNNDRTENEFKLAIEPFSSSVFDFTKDQIRVVLFRECDKRGRKLLFDSNAVEKLPISSHINSKTLISKRKCDQTQHAKCLDFVEVTNSYGYKYKKPSNDVTLLGEMIFGSVAMVFKDVYTCKIHTLSSPKCIMFTIIVYAPGQCHDGISSGHDSSSGPDSGSFSECSNETRASSSDSKLYKHKQSYKNNISTYPCIKHKCLQVKSPCHCIMNNSSQNYEKETFSCDSSNADSLEKVNVNEKSEHNSLAEENKFCQVVKGNSKGFSEYSELSLHSSDKISQNKYKCDSARGYSALKDFEEGKKDICSSSNKLNSSLGGLKRRWMQSCFSSIDQINCEETDKLKNKTRTKLGIGLVVELSNNLKDELENFLFNHTIVIESILKKLQSSIEVAYVKKENFVDLTYTAFINCQQSMYELITGGKYERAMWLTLIGEMKQEALERDTENETSTQDQENIKNCKMNDTLSSVKVKFLNDFCDVLVKFDTKDTNFFISTLLTAVLTHHLSWVTEIAESDLSLPEHKLSSAVKTLHPYNPIWAQLNDLSGILGSPLKSARTVITGSESSKNSIASVIQILTYFIRCYDVVETIYDFDFEDIATVDQSKEKKLQDYKNFDCGVSSKCCSSSEGIKPEQNLNSKERESAANCTEVLKSESDIPVTEHTEEKHLRLSDTFQKTCRPAGMKKSKSSLFCLEEDDHLPLYSNMNDLVKLENIHLSDRNEAINESGSRNNDLCTNECYRKISNLVRVPSNAVLCHLEQSIDRDEDCDTVDSSVFINENANECTKRTEPKDVLFVLGENEELVNLRRVMATESENKDLGKELDSSIMPKNISQSESVNITLPIAEDSKNIDDIKCEKVHDEESIISCFHELPMPRRSEKHYTKRRLNVCSVLGSVNTTYNSEQIIQGVLEDKSKWEKILRKDLASYARDHVLDKNVTEALCIMGDMNSWEVSLISSSSFTMDKSDFNGIRIGMSQLVADMLESLLHIYRIKLPPDFCLNHIEKKLHEIYTKSKCVAELLNSTDVCSIEYLTSRLDINVNDVPLLLSVATTHSPHISSRYGLTYT